jgi:hypothetical protein
MRRYDEVAGNWSLVDGDQEFGTIVPKTENRKPISRLRTSRLLAWGMPYVPGRMRPDS